MNAQFNYTGFGIDIASDIALPQLNTGNKAGQELITIAHKPVSRYGFDSPDYQGAIHQYKEDKLWVLVPHVGRFLIVKGEYIHYEPEPDVDPMLIQLLIQSTFLATLLQQRELLVFNAMAAQRDDQVIVFAGPSVTGKTFLSVCLAQRGYSILTDDVCVVDDRGYVLPGYRQVKLWVDCLRFLKLKPSHDLTPVRTGLEKVYYDLGHAYQSVAKRLQMFCCLASDNTEEPAFDPITGVNKILALRSRLHQITLINETEVLKQQTSKLARLAQLTEACSLVRANNDYKVVKYFEFLNKHLSMTIDDEVFDG